jgi:hypothetical protein
MKNQPNEVPFHKTAKMDGKMVASLLRNWGIEVAPDEAEEMLREDLIAGFRAFRVAMFRKMWEQQFNGGDDS